MNENINQLNENFETYQEILKNDMDYQNNNITSSNEQTKCYCGHTDYCDCGTLEELKQETPKTFKELFANTGIKPTTDANGIVHYNFKATLKDEPKQERMFSEEDMIDFGLWLYLEVGSSKVKERTNKELFNKWLEKYKNK